MTDVGSSPGVGGFGQMFPKDDSADFNSAAFHVRQLIARIRTMIPVKVIKVFKQDGKTEAVQGEIAGAGFVTVQALVSMVDGNNQNVDHGNIFNVPYTRIYGGINAHIMDPKVNDIGYIKIADRDITSFKKNATQSSSGGSSTSGSPSGSGTAGGSGPGGAGGQSGTSAPSTARRHDLADSIYVGGVLNKTPKQYISFTEKGVVVGDQNNNVIDLGPSNVQSQPTPKQFLNFTQTGITKTDKNGNTMDMQPNEFKLLAQKAAITLNAQAANININAFNTVNLSQILAVTQLITTPNIVAGTHSCNFGDAGNSITGGITIDSVTITSAMTVSGSVTGGLTIDTATITGNAAVNGTLTVNGSLTTTSPILIGSIGIYAGSGAPGFTAPKGSLYTNTTATTTTTRLYVNINGATSWANFTSSA